MVLRGWVKCDDGRLYHPVIAEKALEAWKHRLAPTRAGYEKVGQGAITRQCRRRCRGITRGSARERDRDRFPVPWRERRAGPDKLMFDGGLRLLGGGGVVEAKARSLLGKWKRDHGSAAVIAALGRAQREGAIEPVAFIEACLRAQRRAEGLGSGADHG